MSFTKDDHWLSNRLMGEAYLANGSLAFCTTRRKGIGGKKGSGGEEGTMTGRVWRGRYKVQGTSNGVWGKGKERCQIARTRKRKQRRSVSSGVGVEEKGVGFNIWSSSSSFWAC